MKIKTSIIISILIMGLILSFANVNAEPTAETTISPEEIEPLDKVSFSAIITHDQDIDEVIVDVIECDKSAICYTPQSEIMTLNEGVYEAEVTLAHSDATYFQYYFKVTSGETTNDTEIVKVNLKLDSGDNGDTNGEPVDGEGNDSPGFETIVVIGALFIALILFRRKR